MRHPRERRPLDEGQRIRDTFTHRDGVVLDHACQYAHPKAEPVYSYLVRWQDGQVQAYCEGAFQSGGGLELLD